MGGTADERAERRRAAVPEITYPAALPVSRRRDDLLAAIRDHQVVVVAGETGSGKSTQLPKLCLELGRGVTGMIGHTQPRRLAARTLAERIAEELHTPLGGAVGYQVRFTDRVGDDTLVKLMTDGILLAEIQHDKMLRAYDTLIIDEAHERSLNVDFLLGYVRRLLPRRPDLKVIVTSATIDPERFSHFFGGSRGSSPSDSFFGGSRGSSPSDNSFGGAPVVEVSGRTYPVEVRYRPDETGELDQDEAICAAVRELSAEGPGDVLVFLSGEREIRDAADALTREQLRDTEVLPLYARLSAAEQHRVFQPHPGRRVVLATNVAETSLTVPGVRYVVDTGFARISRYSRRTKVQRLPIEPISRASADQRKGRCGRVADGVCIRLYAEDDYLSRPEFTEPEILRTNLASVILQMAAAGLGDVAAFPFLDPPDRRNIADGVQLLEELGALEKARRGRTPRLTRVGRTLARLPVDPRIGRMVLEADRNGCMREVLVIAAALSIQDPRERPADRREAADQLHRRFADPNSDFLAYLNLWRYLREQQKELSSNRFRRLCHDEFLHYLRVREWQDVHAQLRQIAGSVGLRVTSTSADPDLVHQSLLAGLLSHVGVKDGDRNEYQGARGARFGVFPGSALFRKPPTWVMAGELVETSRLWARTVARIEPEWAERLAGHLVRSSYSEPHWEKKRAAVMAYEKVTLYGVPIVASRKAAYGSIDPPLCRELFIRHALVWGEWDTHHRFLRENRDLLERLEDLEHRARRRDILVDDETLFAFYEARIGAEVVSGRHFDSWWKRVRRDQPDLLRLTPELLLTDRAADVSDRDYPDVWTSESARLPVSYLFDPGSPVDGVTVDVPLAELGGADPEEFRWQVPGLREELVTALIRSLPKAIRRHLVPAPDHAKAVLERIAPADGALLDVLSRELRRMTGVEVPRSAWQPDRLPGHLRPNFRVVDDGGEVVAEGRDLAALRERLGSRAAAWLSAAAGDIEREDVRDWTLGTLPRTVSLRRGARTVTAYVALMDERDSVAVRVFATEDEQRAAMWLGTRRLLLLTVPSPVAYVHRQLPGRARLVLGRNPDGDFGALLDDCLTCAADHLMREAGGPAWDEEAFGKLRDHVRTGLADVVLDAVTTVERVLAVAHRVEARLAEVAGAVGEVGAPAVADLRTQLARLVHPGFVTGSGYRRLSDLVRYLRAMERRLDKLGDDPYRDADRMRAVQDLEREYARVRAEHAGRRDLVDALDEVGWMLEELRVSYFAQRLGTAYPVSEKRILRALDDVSG